MKLSADFIRQLPKVLLHEHLDGGLRPQTVIDLAASCRYQGLPTSDPVELGQWFHRCANKGNLHEYLEGFAHTIGVRVGNGCASVMDSTMRNLACRLIQMDEIWGFIGKKKVYGNTDMADQRRYSPAKLVSVTKQAVAGNPYASLISTSYIERQNLTMRMHMRRLTRLTNGFSKKIENFEAAVALHFGYYNFVRVHKTLRCTPAMAGGVTDHIWTLP